MVVFLTDGMPTIGETDPRRIVESYSRGSGASQLFVFGVGDDVNTTFLDQLATANRGAGDYFRDGAEMEQRISAFYDRIAYPVLTDLRLTFPGANTFDVYPRDLGHLYRGGQLLVVGRYRGDGASRVELVGRPSHERAASTFGYGV
jgi:Ca-activated chloride channel family protein